MYILLIVYIVRVAGATLTTSEEVVLSEFVYLIVYNIVISISRVS